MSNIDCMSTPLKNCINCCKELSNRRSKYCSHSCQQDFQYKNEIQRWESGVVPGWRGSLDKPELIQISNPVRRYMFDKYGRKCSKCGWAEVNTYSQNCPVQIDHIDGNVLNCQEDNLQILCPNCHSLTDNYGALNRRFGRRSRGQSNTI